MVHAIPATSPGNRLRLDPQRIVAGAGAITFNAVLLLLLLIPITAPQLLPEPIRPPEVIWFDPIKPKPIPPVPAPVDPVPPRPQPKQQVVQPQPTPKVEPAPAPVVKPMPTDIAAPPVSEQVPTASSAEPGPPQPASGVRLGYARAPAPPYPRDALIHGIAGTVLLEVLVDVDGRPLQVDIARSSGNRDLDRAARRQVLRHWLFEPAMRDGRPVQARGLAPIEFSLD